MISTGLYEKGITLTCRRDPNLVELDIIHRVVTHDRAEKELGDWGSSFSSCNKLVPPIFGALAVPLVDHHLGGGVLSGGRWRLLSLCLLRGRSSLPLFGFVLPLLGVRLDLDCLLVLVKVIKAELD